LAAFGISSHPLPAVAAGEVAGQLLDAGARHADLVIAGVTPGYAGVLPELAELWSEVLEPTVLLVATVVSVTLVSPNGTASGLPPPTGGERSVAGSGIALAAGAVGPLAGRVLGPDGLAEEGPPPFRPAGSIVLGAPNAIRALLGAAGASGTPEAGGPGVTGVLGGCGPGGVAVGGTLGAERAGRLAAERGAVVAYLGVAPSSGSASALRPLGGPLRADDTDGRVLARLDGSPAFDLLVELTRDGVAAVDLPRVGAGLHVERLGDDGRPDGPPIPVLGRQAGGSGLALGAAVPTGSHLRFLLADPVSLRRAVSAALGATVSSGGAAGRADGAVVFAPPGAGKLLREAPVPTVPPSGYLCLELAHQVVGAAGLLRAGVGCVGMPGPWA